MKTVIVAVVVVAVMVVKIDSCGSSRCDSHNSVGISCGNCKAVALVAVAGVYLIRIQYRVFSVLGVCFNH